MEDKGFAKISKEQLKAALSEEFDSLLDRMVDAINKAEYGSIIDQSEEPVRDAHGDFRSQAYQKALELLVKQKSFSPSGDNAGPEMAEQRSSKGKSSDGKRKGRNKPGGLLE